ncbi:hypothetical protein CPAV1605_527 [seawater metagenome]|uniref:Uncharacterized protein n=1 Tax=seawater metagenome TaxID=1561972 RepID=A0A5E8CLN9_9ZZZZ
MLKNIYIITIIILALLAVTIFMKKYSDYKYQIEKINMLEEKENNKKDKLRYYRSVTKACDIKGLKNPRNCYFGSNYKCSWNEQANRCNIKED